MKRLFVIHRRVAFQLGDCVVQAVQAYESPEEAARECKKRDGAVANLFNAKLVDSFTGEDMEGQVKEFIASLGIVSIGHAVAPVSVTPEKLVTPSGDNVMPIGSNSPIIVP